MKVNPLSSASLREAATSGAEACGGAGGAEGLLSGDAVRRIVSEALAAWDLAGKKVLMVVPDQTRSCPLDLLFRLIHDEVGASVRALDVMIALGTHPPMSEEAIRGRLGITEDEQATRYGKVRFLNHAWDDPDQLLDLGTFPAADIEELTEGRFRESVPVRCNRVVAEYDELVIVGPVFPHEVAGFSGGNKYLFPGISGPEVLNFFHWLGAVITSPGIIGRKWTPVRRVIDASAARVPANRRAFCMVVGQGGLHGLYYGPPEDAWSAAADLSSRTHIRYHARPYHTVLSCAPEMYDELWVGAKCMYKLEPVVADGGRLIIYAPHIKEVAVVHDEAIRRIGYHTRDYFLNQWDRFKHEPWGILAHSTHVKGMGTCEDGVEIPRIEVVLATGIPEEVCREINLGYLDPESIDPSDYRNREDEGVLYVPRAGEILHRLESSRP